MSHEITCKTGQMSVRPSVRPCGVGVSKTPRPLNGCR